MPAAASVNNPAQNSDGVKLGLSLTGRSLLFRHAPVPDDVAAAAYGAPGLWDGVEKGRIVKMLPLFLNAKGHDAISPSLYDRDAYQAYLRQHTNEISAIRFDVLWQVESPAAAKYKLRIELRGIGPDGKPTRSTLEVEAPPPLLRRWHSLVLGGADYRSFGELVAWRATLWHGDQLLSEQKSFLW